MIVAVHQPQYLPWLGYFDKMDRADVFVLLDNVQFKKNEWQNRNRIKTSQGWQWLTVPVKYRFPQKVKEVEINNQVKWGHKHLQALRTNYLKTGYFGDHRPFFEEIFARDWIRLVDLNVCIIDYLRDTLGISTQIRMASKMALSEEPNQRLIDICREVGADMYLAGAGGRDYMDLSAFERAGLRVEFQEYIHPVYPQLFGDFQPNMSVVDLLFNCGPESLEIIRKGRKGGG